MWQQKFEQYGNDDFTIVGLALDIDGVSAANQYYKRFGVKFPALADADYATGFGAVPRTFFVDEHGVIHSARRWETQLKSAGPLRPVTQEIRDQFTAPGERLAPQDIARLSAAVEERPEGLDLVTDLASRYLALGLSDRAEIILKRALKDVEVRAVAKAGSDAAVLVGQAYLLLSRAVEDRAEKVEAATLSFYLNPSIGFGKQIARVIAPEKFDGRPQGDFDNQFREATLRRLRRERSEWLEGE